MASFGAQITAYAEKYGQRLEDVDRAFKLQLFNMVVQRTRVDTGRLRGNWQVTDGSPAAGTVERLQPSGGLNAGDAARIQPFSETWLTNNLPYALKWEEVDGMVSTAVADAKRIMAQKVRDERQG